jgi:hypothetical protein
MKGKSESPPFVLSSVVERLRESFSAFFLAGLTTEARDEQEKCFAARGVD